jgi:hypothetical protein
MISIIAQPLSVPKVRSRGARISMTPLDAVADPSLVAMFNLNKRAKTEESCVNLRVVR